MRIARSAAGWTVAVFGGMALLSGATGLLAPGAVLDLLGFEVLDPARRAVGDYTRTFLAASSMASFNMGVYYLLAAARDWRPFFAFTVPFRLLTCTVFCTLTLTDVAPPGFVGVGLWEGLGAVATLAALVWERRRPEREGLTRRMAGGAARRVAGGAADGAAVSDAPG